MDNMQKRISKISRIKKEIKPEDLPDLTFDFNKSENRKVNKKDRNIFKKPMCVRSDFII